MESKTKRVGELGVKIAEMENDLEEWFSSEQIKPKLPNDFFARPSPQANEVDEQIKSRCCVFEQTSGQD